MELLTCKWRDRACDGRVLPTYGLVRYGCHFAQVTPYAFPVVRNTILNKALRSFVASALLRLGAHWVPFCLDVCVLFRVFNTNISEPVPYTFVCVLNTFHTSLARQPTVALGFCFRVGLLDTKSLRSYPRRQKLGIL